MRISDWSSDVCSSDLDRCLSCQCCQVGADKSKGRARQFGEIHLATQRHAAGVDAKYFTPPAFIRHADDDLTIKTTGAAERFINYFGTVSRGDDDRIDAGLQTVQYRPQFGHQPLFGSAGYFPPLGSTSGA